MGVSDDRIGEALDVILRAARQVIKPALVLDPPEPEVVEIAEKKLVIATVRSSDGSIYQAGGIFWMRRGTQTSALNALELSEMMYDRGLRNWELEPAYNATLDDIDAEKVQAYLDRRLAGGGHAGRFKDIAPVLVGMRCATPVTDGKVVSTNAGILFFSRNPPWHIIQAEGVCVLFRKRLARAGMLIAGLSPGHCKI